MLAISVLGPVELRGDGRLLALPAGKTTEILVRLALDAMVTVSADRLIEDVWGVEPTSVARNAVQSKISKLRRALGYFVAASTARLVNEEFPGMCMEPEKPNEASIVRMKPCSSSLPSAQIWKDHARLFNGQVVHQWSNLTSHMCLDVSEASQAANALVIQFPCTNGANQLFKHTVV